MISERDSTAVIDTTRIQMEKVQLRSFLQDRNKAVEDYFASFSENDFSLTRYEFRKSEHPHDLITTTIYETEFVNRENDELARKVIPKTMQAALNALKFDLDQPMQLKFRIARYKSSGLGSVDLEIKQGELKLSVSNVRASWPDRKPPEAGELADLISQLEPFEDSRELIASIIEVRSDSGAY